MQSPQASGREQDSAPRPPRRPAFALFCVYALFIFYATLLPFQFVVDGQALQAKRHVINWNPIHLVTGEPTPLVDLVINIIFFAPLGVIGYYAQRRRPVGSALLRLTLAGAALSACCEALQFFTPSRNPATSDVLTNTLGASLGGLLAAAFQLRMRGPTMQRLGRWVKREPLLPVLAGLLCLLVVSSMVPFDFAIGLRWVVRALRRAQLDPWRDPEPWSAQLLSGLLYAMLAGLAFRVTQQRAGVLLRAVGCAFGAGLLALLLELLQLALRSHVASTRDVLSALLGGFAGVSAAIALGDGARARHGWKLAAFCYAACLVARGAQPYDFQLDAQAIRGRLALPALVPYYSYYYKANVAAVADFLDGLFTYVPFGFLLAHLSAQRPVRSALRLGATATGLCALMALAVEVLQLTLPSRFPEVSEVLTAALGGALGAFLWRWMAELRPDASLPAKTAGLSDLERPHGHSGHTWTSGQGEGRSPIAPAAS